MAPTPSTSADATVEATGSAGVDDRGDVVDLTIDPVTRVSGGGSQAFHATVDLSEATVVSGKTGATLFRGYERILEGRDPRDAVDLASRVCGDTGVVHSITAAMALEMALPVEPPRLGLWVRNMGQASAFLYNLAGHLFLRAGPDYSAAMLAETNPGLLERAGATSALHHDVHGYETVGDIMAALNPPEGELYDTTIERARDVQELISLVMGKFPHPSTAAPGGMTTTLERNLLTQYYKRIKDLADFAKTVPPLWDDLLDFMLEHADGYAEAGTRSVNLATAGAWDDPDVYTARYEDADEWGSARLSPPGVVVDGELVTTDLTEIDAGIAEHVDRSFYDDWTGGSPRFETSPAGEEISARHPWNKETRASPADRSWNGSYSWTTAPRWNGTPMETGAIARQWVAALAGGVDHPLVEPTGDGLNLTLPEVAEPEVTFRWEVPDRLNVAERLRAEAYNLAYGGIGCYVGLIEALDALRTGHETIHTPFSVPSGGPHRGVGLWESGRGLTTHHAVVEDGSLESYQILTPSTWALSPADAEGVSGPLEAAVAGTPLGEDYDDRTDLTGVDVLRVVRSFDPCMVCAVH